MSPSTEQRENREFAAELKFLVSRPAAEQIRDWARQRLAPDPHSSAELADGYQITSVYFDTEKFDVFHRIGSYGRSKYRIRRYGSSSTVFLERKLKTRGLVTKRRSVVNLAVLDTLNQAAAAPGWTGLWFQQRLVARRFRPVCQIGYRRTARVCAGPHGPIRLTMDENLRALPLDQMRFNDRDEGILLLPEHIIIELKFRIETPLLFKEAVEQFKLNAQPISKYRMAVIALGLASEFVSPLPQNELSHRICLSS